MNRVLTLTLAASIALVALAAPTHALPEPDAVARGVAFLRGEQAPDGGIGGFAISAWVALAAVSAGEDPAAWKAATDAPSLADHLVAQGAAQHDLFASTDWSRQTLALAAAGVDVRSAGGVDYVAGLLGTFNGGQFGDPELMFDDYFGVLALHAAGEAPETVAAGAAWIRSNQLPDGGWSWRSRVTTNPFFVAFGPTSDIDSTATAIQSLLAAGAPADDVAIQQGFAFVKTHQYLDGGCGGTLVFDLVFNMNLESNTASTAWVVDALTAAGVNPQSPFWTSPTGSDLVDFLLARQFEDGSFGWTASNPGGFFPGTDIWMTAYAVTALSGGSYVIG